MFSGGSRTIAPTYTVRADSLTLRPYQQKLTELTQNICSTIEGTSEVSDRCLFEARTAFDCVLRNKVRQFSSQMDNVGPCKPHLDNMKTALGASSASIIDAQCDKLHYAR
mmetsp:Transcript_32273/g.40021  ORF Transcript_32273/g.40021 Transcript_32273/m.40021 type:complete len:110 (-) Transcript_32273:1567-1896(-)